VTWVVGSRDARWLRAPQAPHLKSTVPYGAPVFATQPAMEQAGFAWLSVV